MEEGREVVNQWLRDFTVQIRASDEQKIMGTGIALSMDGKIATCAHVIEDVLKVHPRQAGEQTVTVYFPQARRDDEKKRKAKVYACFPNHEDDLVVLQIIDGTMPLAPQQLPVIGKCEGSSGDEFNTYGYRQLVDVKETALSGDGRILDILEIPDAVKRHGGRIQLETKHVKGGMSGAAVLDRERNLVVGIISAKYYTQGTVDPDLAFAVNARLLSLEPLNIPLHPARKYPRKAGRTPQLTDEQWEKVGKALLPKQPDFTRAPHVLEEWVGRDDLLAHINDHYDDPHTRVIGLIGYGGEGKTSLARKALERLMAGENAPAAVFWWSFYEERSPDAFFEAALTYLGGARMAADAKSANERASLIAALAGDRKVVFVLDGFEVMQHEDGDEYGAITSEALRDLVDMIATVGGDSFTILTSRAPIVDLMAHITYRQLDVDRLSAADGRDLLRAVGVTGTDAALDKLVELWDGHALTLSLIGSALRDMFGGDVAHADEIPPPTADESRYDRVKRVLRRYDDHMSDAERAFLMLFSAFRKPVRADSFGRVFRTATGKSTLNAPLLWFKDADFDKLVNGLIVRRLIRPVTESDGTTAYTAHPLIRAHYADRLHARADAPAAHGQIAEYYKADAPADMPRFPTLDDLAPYLEIVHHLCAAGAYDEAEDVRWERIDQGNRGYIVYVLGAYETTLALMTGFFPGGDLTRDPAVSEPGDQRFILNEIGVCLMSLGRLRAAAAVYERNNIATAEAGDAHNASIGEQNLADLYAALGEINASASAARRALDLSAQVTDEQKRQQDERTSQTLLGWALHLSGDLPGAAAAFARAETLERAIDPNKQYLYSGRGIQHADHLRRAGDPAYARRVTDANVTICERNGWTFLISQCHRILGDLDADAGAHDSARGHYDQAVALARKIDKIDVRIEALHGRGLWYAKHQKDAPAAFNDLNEALDYAVRGEYRIYQADIRIALAWAHLANGDTDQARREAESAQAMSAQMGYHWGKVDAAAVLERV